MAESKISYLAEALKLKERTLKDLREAMDRIEKDTVTGVRIVVGGMCSLDTYASMELSKKPLLQILRNEEKRHLRQRKDVIAQISDLSKE